MFYGKTVGLVIPALNEAQSIARVLADLPAGIDRVVVVDNGSDDGTGAIAGQLGVQVVGEPRRGYGAACQAGVAALAHAQPPDLVAFVDADYSDYPIDLGKVIEPVARGQSRFSIGVRVAEVRTPGALPLHQRLGNRLACGVIAVLHGFRFKDLGPMRCIEFALLQQLGMVDRGHGWTAEMQIKALHCGEQAAQVSVGYRSRLGKSKISGTVTGSLLAAGKILYWSFRLRLIPLRTARCARQVSANLRSSRPAADKQTVQQHRA